MNKRANKKKRSAQRKAQEAAKASLTKEVEKGISSSIDAVGRPTVPSGRASAGLNLKEVSSGEPAEDRTAKPKLRAAFYVDGFNLYHGTDWRGENHMNAKITESFWWRRDKLGEAVDCGYKVRKLKRHPSEGYSPVASIVRSTQRVANLNRWSTPTPPDHQSPARSAREANRQAEPGVSAR